MFTVAFICLYIFGRFVQYFVYFFSLFPFVVLIPFLFLIYLFISIVVSVIFIVSMCWRVSVCFFNCLHLLCCSNAVVDKSMFNITMYIHTCLQEYIVIPQTMNLILLSWLSRKWKIKIVFFCYYVKSFVIKVLGN